MDRKQFLGTLFVLPVGVFLVHCSSDSTPSTASGGTPATGTGGTSSSDPTAPAAAPTQSGGMDVYTSSISSGHVHTFTVNDADITTPPAAGVSGDSSTDESHSHTVTISSDQLAQVGTGESVQVTSGVTGAHTHVFTFVKIA